MDSVRRHEADAAVESSKKREIRAHRNQVVIGGIVHAHREQVVSGKIERRSRIETEPRKPAAVAAQPPAIQKNLGAAAGAIELQEHPPSGPARVHAKMPAIPAVAPKIVPAAVLSIPRVPGVRQRDGLPCRVVERRHARALGRPTMKPPAIGQHHFLPGAVS